MVHIHIARRDFTVRPLPWIIMGITVVLAVLFAEGTLKLPLLGDHCMKTSKSVEVSYNIVRYRDPLHAYSDWKATPADPFGKRGSIIAHESPLSALFLAALYLVVDGEDFEVRLDTARYFTLCHLIAAYLLLSLFLFRKELMALGAFSFLMILSAFTVSYATKPLAETYAIFYQALFIVIGASLLHEEMSPLKKAAILAATTGFICLGGKMNYFLIAAPLVVAFPFIDDTLRGTKPRLRYFALLGALIASASLVLVLFTKFSFSGAFLFMIRGNEPLVDDSLWKSFVNGFSGFSAVYSRTKTDFGTVAFVGGAVGCLYLIVRLIFFIIHHGKEKHSEWNKCRSVLGLVVLGHVFNYLVLKNLYTPHKYYVVPLYTVFCLAFAVLIADLKRALLDPMEVKDRIRRRMTALLTPRLSGLRARLEQAPAWIGSLFTVSFFFVLVAVIARWLAHGLATEESWETAFIYAVKGVNSGYLAMNIVDGMARISSILTVVATFSVVAAVALLVSALVFLRARSSHRVLDKIYLFLRRHGFIAKGIAFVFALTLCAGYAAVKNSQAFYEYACAEAEHIELADSLRKIRESSKSGDLVLCWKWCIAFYADKRSITDATTKDLAYYQENNLYSVMGPVKPLNNYYKRIDNYPEPMSYWRPMTREEIADQKRKNARPRLKR